MLQRVLCWMGFHAVPAGLNATRCLYWCCAHCRQLVRGELAGGRRR